MKHLSRINTSNKFRYLVFANGLIVLLATSSGCIPLVPQSTNLITEQTVQSIQPMKSTRADVLLTLADPAIRGDQDNYFIYRWEHLHGAVIFFPGFPAGGAGAASCNSLVIKFMPDGGVDRVKQFSGKSNTTYAPTFSHDKGSEFLSGYCDAPEISKAINDWLETGPDH